MQRDYLGPPGHWLREAAARTSAAFLSGHRSVDKQAASDTVRRGPLAIFRVDQALQARGRSRRSRRVICDPLAIAFRQPARSAFMGLGTYCIQAIAAGVHNSSVAGHANTSDSSASAAGPLRRWRSAASLCTEAVEAAACLWSRPRAEGPAPAAASAAQQAETAAVSAAERCGADMACGAP